MFKRAICVIAFASATLTNTASSGPSISPNQLNTRLDLLMLKDEGNLGSPVLTWPFPLGRQNPDVNVDFGSSALEALENRIAALYSEESELGTRPLEAYVSFAGNQNRFRSFGWSPRSDFEAGASFSWLSEWIAGNLSFSFADNPDDGDEFRLDGSYLSLAVGNWALSLEQVDRWWGPGWDGSLILSNNARPVPSVSLTRISPDAFETKWLRWIGPWTFTTFMGQLDNEEPVNDEGVAVGSDALLFGMRIDFSPFGWDNLDIGLTRTAQWAGEGRPSGLDTFWKLLIGEDNVVPGSNVTHENEPGNQLAGVDYRFRIPGLKIAQYAQVIGEDEETFLPDACMVMAGVETWGTLDAANATWRAYFEWADTRAGYLRRDPLPDRDLNTAYNHGIYKTGYRRHNRAIGHTMDGDGVMRSLGFFFTSESGDLWGLKYRNYSLNRDAKGPNSVTIDPIEGQSFEVYSQMKVADSKWENWLSPNLILNASLHFIDEENQITGEQEDDFGGYLSILTSF